jgi:hypothetical protein
LFLESLNISCFHAPHQDFKSQNLVLLEPRLLVVGVSLFSALLFFRASDAHRRKRERERERERERAVVGFFEGGRQSVIYLLLSRARGRRAGWRYSIM